MTKQTLFFVLTMGSKASSIYVMFMTIWSTTAVVLRSDKEKAETMKKKISSTDESD